MAVGAFNGQGGWPAAVKNSSRSDGSALEGDHPDDCLKRGARWVSSTDGTVDEGLHRVFLELGIVVAAFTSDQQVGVVSGTGDESKDLSCRGLDGYNGTHFALHQLLTIGLQLGIHS